MIVDFKVTFGKQKNSPGSREIGEDVFANVWPQKDGSLYGDASVFVVVKGYFLDSLGADFPKHLAYLYKKNGKEALGKLDGVFTAFVFDKKKQVGYFFQDNYGQGYPLYYFQNKNSFIVSTFLQSVISEIGKVEFNFGAAKDFLAARYIVPGDKTLIKNINKLASGKMLAYDAKKGRMKTVEKWQADKKFSKKQAKEKLLRSIGGAVEKICKISDGKKTAMTLSGGYDTNLISYFLDKCHSFPIKAFTVAGKRKDETAQAGLAAEKCDKISHESIKVSDDALDEFAEMVRRLEGNVCESGIILQYFLAKKVAQAGMSGIILGDCADQVLDPNIEKFSALKEKIKATKIGDWVYKVLGSHQRKSKYFQLQKKLGGNGKINNLQLQFILRKSAVMMASFGIQGYYPFLNQETQKCSQVLGLGNLDKKFYKKQVEKLFEKEGFPTPKKMGGSTDIEYLLDSKRTEIKKILESGFVAKIIEDKKILREIKKNHEKLSELVLLLLYLYFFNLIFVEKIENPDF